MALSINSPSGIQVRGPLRTGYDQILTTDALRFLAELHRRFNNTRLRLLEARVERQKRLDNGELPHFLDETAWIRQSEWRGPCIPPDLQDRRVEITGPVDRKMVINALNSGAKVFMADFEDATAPTWDNLITGHINLRDAQNRTITFQQGEKSYKLNQKVATIMVRPRGWHLHEAHITVDGQEMSGSLFDFGLYFFHNAKNTLSRGTGPYFYLPKMESHKEARLWNDVFVFAQDYIGIPVGSIRATVLIETIMGVFEMDEIIYELRQHSAGLNCGRWDYMFSYIKKLKHSPKYVLPDRALVGMTAPFMANYVRLLVRTCHRRGVHAMGGMAAQIPIANNPQANAAVFEKVRADKLREVKAGCDGTWVAHPGLIPVAMEVFNAHLKTPNQIESNPGDQTPVDTSDLLELKGIDQKQITIGGLRANIDVGLSYIEAWLRGVGCVPLHNLMEDAATAEMSRAQVWQWIKHNATTVDGVKITRDRVKSMLHEVVQQYKQNLGAEAYSKRKYDLAAKLYGQMLLSDHLDEFLTSVAYPYITSVQQQSKF